MKAGLAQNAETDLHMPPGGGVGTLRSARGGWLAPGCTLPSPAVAELIHDQFRALVLHPSFSCLGAKAALRGGSYQMGIYDELGSAEATLGLVRDLSAFAAASFVDAADGERANGFTTFVASFL